MYTKDDLKKLYTTAINMKLSGAHLLNTSDAYKYCNGLGAEWMPTILRDALSIMNPTLDPVVAIHDQRYEIGGSEEDRDAADKEFLENGLKAADYEYSWYNPLRYYVRKQARKYYALLSMFGGAAWRYTEEDEKND